MRKQLENQFGGGDNGGNKNVGGGFGGEGGGGGPGEGGSGKGDGGGGKKPMSADQKYSLKGLVAK